MTTERPVKIGEIKEIEIEQIGQKDDGIGKINNFIIIVKNSKLGKKYKIQITGVYATYGYGRIIEEIQKPKTATEIMKEILKED